MLTKNRFREYLLFTTTPKYVYVADCLQGRIVGEHCGGIAWGIYTGRSKSNNKGHLPFIPILGEGFGPLSSAASPVINCYNESS